VDYKKNLQKSNVNDIFQANLREFAITILKAPILAAKA